MGLQTPVLETATCLNNITTTKQISNFQMIITLH